MKLKTAILVAFLCIAPLYSAVQFDNVNDRLNIPTSPVIEDTVAQNKEFTVSFWMNANTSGLSGYGIVYYKGQVAIPTLFAVGFSATNAMSVFLTGGTNMRLPTTDNAITMGRDIHVLCTVNLTGVAADNHIYLDGVEAAYGVTSDVVTPRYPTNMAQNIGDSDGNTDPFDGTITELAVWNKRLSIDEIKLLASSKVKRMPLQVSPRNLVSYYPMDDYEDGKVLGSANFLVDMSSNALHATPANSPIMKGEKVLTYP